MNNKKNILNILKKYSEKLNDIKKGYEDYYKKKGKYSYPGNKYELKQIVIEIKDLLFDYLGKNQYSSLLIQAYYDGIDNFFNSPSYNCIRDIISIVSSVITRLERNPNLKESIESSKIESIRENIFIIHGHDEAKWRELREIIKEEFNLNPIVLKLEPTGGSKTIIEKIEEKGKTCSFAIALFTPDDVVEKDRKKYVQARPNVLFELGWFCGRIGRNKVIMILKEGTEIFSDFDGVIQLRFKKDVQEIQEDLRKELKDVII